jgi:hypothetical protein
LQAAAVEKTEKYEPLHTIISGMYPELRDVCVVPLVFGSHGCVPPEMLGVLSRFDFTRKAVEDISIQILRDSLKIFACFMELVTRVQITDHQLLATVIVCFSVFSLEILVFLIPFRF